jgi:uncharacterized damage-inducible protein DinB
MDDRRTADKATLHRYLTLRRGELVSKLDGLDEYDIRRPMTPTGTNLLGMVKHVGLVELEYFGVVFDRHDDTAPPWQQPEWERDADMWATADESRGDILALSHRGAARCDARVAELELDAVGVVPWWPAERREVTLQQVLVHLVAEVARHAGHADILRELIDGSAGMKPGDANLSDLTVAQWAEHCARIEAAAATFRAAGQPG